MDFYLKNSFVFLLASYLSKYIFTAIKKECITYIPINKTFILFYCTLNSVFFMTNVSFLNDIIICLKVHKVKHAWKNKNGYGLHHISHKAKKKGSGYERCQMVNGQFVLIHESTGGIQELETHLCTCKDAERQIVCITDRMFKAHTRSYVDTWNVLAFGCTLSRNSLMENLIHLTFMIIS